MKVAVVIKTTVPPTSENIKMTNNTQNQNGTGKLLGTSIKIPIKDEELIEMTDTFETVVLTEDQQHTIASLFAGVGSGTISSIVCAPLDLVKTRMQVLGDLSKNRSIEKRDLSIIRSIEDIIQKESINKLDLNLNLRPDELSLDEYLQLSSLVKNDG